MIEVESAGIVRTARLLFSGDVMVPDWALPQDEAA